MFLGKVCYGHQGCIYFINNAVTIVILLQFEMHVPYFNITSIAIYISDGKD